jgi:hypothetical protein
MRSLWVMTLGLVALTAAEGCKQRSPEPVPPPKASPAETGHVRAAGIAWFQGALDEAFASPGSVHTTCGAERPPMAPLAPDLPRVRTRVNPPSPMACQGDHCPTVVTPRRPLV